MVLAIEYGATCYTQMMYNLFCNNCHSYVARCLNTMEYDGFTHWNMVILCFYSMIYSRYVSWPRLAYTYVPFLICVTLYWYFNGLTKSQTGRSRVRN